MRGGPGSATPLLHCDYFQAWHIVHGNDAGGRTTTDWQHADTSATQIAAIVRDGFPAGYCFECIGTRLGIPSTHAVQVLVRPSPFGIAERECYTCGRMVDDVLVAAGPPQ